MLDTDLTPSEIDSVFVTFGTGTEITDGTLFSTITPPPSSEIIIPLNEIGLALLNANLGAEVTLTGRMGDLTILDPGGEMSELIFGLSDLETGSGPTGLAVPFLSLTTVPEAKSTPLLLGLAALGLALGVRPRAK